MLKYAVDIPKMPSDPNARALKKHIEEIHPKYDWRECLDFLIEISEYKDTHGKNPRTGDLADALSITGEKVRKFADTMEPTYIHVDRKGRKVFIIIEGEPHFGYANMQQGFERVMGKLEEYSRETMPSIEEEWRDDLRFLCDEISDLIVINDLFGAVRKYNELIRKLSDYGVPHDLPTVMVRSTAYSYELSDYGEKMVHFLGPRGRPRRYKPPGSGHAEER